MSVQAIGWVLDEVRGVRLGARCVLLVLANFADERGTCWPSVRTIADQTEMSPRAVRDNLRRLEAAGLVCTERRTAQNGASRASRYHLQMAEGGGEDSAGGRGKQTQGGGGSKRRGRSSEPSVEPSMKQTRASRWSATRWEDDLNGRLARIGVSHLSVEGRDAILAALQRWLDWRKLDGKTAYRTASWITSSRRGCLGRLIDDGLLLYDLVEAIDYSIDREYAGIFAPTAKAPRIIDPVAERPPPDPQKARLRLLEIAQEALGDLEDRSVADRLRSSLVDADSAEAIFLLWRRETGGDLLTFLESAGVRKSDEGIAAAQEPGR